MVEVPPLDSNEDRQRGEAVVAGHICLDIIPEVRSRDIVFSEGGLLEIGRAVVATGGAVSNTGLALHRLGIRTVLVGKVGSDLFGRAVRESVSRYDPLLNEGMIENPEAITSYSVILNPPGRDRMLLHCPGCNDTFSSAEVPYERLHEVRLLHFGYPPLMRRLLENDGAELEDIFCRAKQTGVTTSLDMCMPDEASFAGQVNWPVILSRVLRHVDIFMPSFEETLVTLYREKLPALSSRRDGMLSMAEPELVGTMCRQLLDLGPSIVGLKLGDRGFCLRTAAAGRWQGMGRARPEKPEEWISRELWSPCFRTQVVGTTGAGDTSIAGFLASLLRGGSPEECLVFACAVGACNAEAADALSGIRDQQSTKERISAGWERLALPFAMNGWRWLEGEGVWSGPDDRFSVEAHG